MKRLELQEAEQWIDERAHLIAVRTLVDGRWRSLFLTELSPVLFASERARLAQRMMDGFAVITVRTLR